MDRLMTVREAGEILGVSMSTMRRWISAGRISVVRVEGAVRISESWLREYVAQRTGPARQEGG